MAVSFRVEDRAFVQVAIDECRRLDMEKYAPRAIIWAAKLAPDQCVLLRDYLLLPGVMIGKLQPEEWRALITSAAIQRELLKPSIRMFRSLALWCGAGVVIALASIVGGAIIFRNLQVSPLPGSVESALSLSLISLPFSMGVLWRQSYARGRRLKADIQAVDEAGAQTLLQTLTKIQSLNIVIEPGRIRRIVSDWPNLSLRITNLEIPRTPRRSKVKRDQFESLRKRWGLHPPAEL